MIRYQYPLLCFTSGKIMIHKDRDCNNFVNREVIRRQLLCLSHPPLHVTRMPGHSFLLPCPPNNRSSRSRVTSFSVPQLHPHLYQPDEVRYINTSTNLMRFAKYWNVLYKTLERTAKSETSTFETSRFRLGVTAEVVGLKLWNELLKLSNDTTRTFQKRGHNANISKKSHIYRRKVSLQQQEHLRKFNKTL